MPTKAQDLFYHQKRLFRYYHVENNLQGNLLFKVGKIIRKWSKMLCLGHFSQFAKQVPF